MGSIKKNNEDNPEVLASKGDLLPKANQKLFDTVFENYPDMIHSVDKEGQICFANKMATTLLGFENKELIGKSVFEIYCDDIAPHVKKGFAELKEEGIKKVRSKLKSKLGEIIDVEIRSVSMYDQNDEFVRTYSIVRDMRELNSLKAQIKQSSKLASIGEFASGIMHDIRNPLTVIFSYAKKIEKALDKNEIDRVPKALEKIVKATSKIEALSKRTRSFVRDEVEEPVITDLTLILQDALLMLESKIKESDVIINENLSGNSFLAECRPNQIEQVFMNLISNACDELSECEKREIDITAKDMGNHFLINFKDSGPGIPEKIQGLIFDSFFTTKIKGKGTGLGLSVTKNIIREHGGDLQIISTEGEGAIFEVKIYKIFIAPE